MGHQVFLITLRKHSDLADDLAPPQLEDARLGQQVLGPGLAEKLMFRFEVTAISTAPRRPRMTAYIAASASAMMVGPDNVPPGRTSLP